MFAVIPVNQCCRSGHLYLTGSCATYRAARRRSLEPVGCAIKAPDAFNEVSRSPNARSVVFMATGRSRYDRSTLGPRRGEQRYREAVRRVHADGSGRRLGQPETGLQDGVFAAGTRKEIVGAQGEVVHGTQHLPTACPGELEVPRCFNLGVDQVARNPQCQQDPAQGATEFSREGPVPSRQNHRQQGPLTLAQHQSSWADVEEVRVPITEDAG